MQYLNLVYLAKWNGEAPSGRRFAQKARMPAAHALPDRRGDRPDDDAPFFTDGPYVETKEYPGAGRDV